MILSVNKTLLKYYFKSHIFFDMHVTKNYVQTFKEDLCHALIVEKSFLHQILSTIVFKSGEIPSFQESNHSIIGPIQLIIIITQRITPVNYFVVLLMPGADAKSFGLPCIGAQQGCICPLLQQNNFPLFSSVPASLGRKLC